MNPEIWPTEIRLTGDRKNLVIVFDNQETVHLSAEKLRTESPSAEVQGHHPSQKKIITGKQNVKVINVISVGNYAVRFAFDDGHDTGIYSWNYLYNLGRQV